MAVEGGIPDWCPLEEMKPDWCPLEEMK